MCYNWINSYRINVLSEVFSYKAVHSRIILIYKMHGEMHREYYRAGSGITI